MKPVIHVIPKDLAVAMAFPFYIKVTIDKKSGKHLLFLVFLRNLLMAPDDSLPIPAFWRHYVNCTRNKHLVAPYEALDEVLETGYIAENKGTLAYCNNEDVESFFLEGDEMVIPYKFPFEVVHVESALEVFEIEGWKNSNYPERRDLERDFTLKANLLNCFTFPLTKTAFQYSVDGNPNLLETTKCTIELEDNSNRYMFLLNTSGFANADSIIQFLSNTRIKHCGSVDWLGKIGKDIHREYRQQFNTIDMAQAIHAKKNITEPGYFTENDDTFHASVSFGKKDMNEMITKADIAGGLNTQVFRPFFPSLTETIKTYVLIKPTGTTGTGIDSVAKNVIKHDFKVTNIAKFNPLPLVLINDLYTGDTSRPWRKEWNNYLQSNESWILELELPVLLCDVPLAPSEIGRKRKAPTSNKTSAFIYTIKALDAMKKAIRADGHHIWTRNEVHAPENIKEHDEFCDILSKFLTDDNKLTCDNELLSEMKLKKFNDFDSV